MSVIIDKNANAIGSSVLKNLGIPYYLSTNLDFMYRPVNTHPDMQIHFINSQTAVVAPSAFKYYKDFLPTHINLVKGFHDPGRTYPEDCAYNVAKLGKRIIGNIKYVDKKILEVYKNFNFEFINVKQGYTKCNLCIVDDNAVITEDEGLYAALIPLGVDVLKISSGSVALEGFKNGFIGGASGFLSENVLGFWGNLDNHPDKDRILNFIKQRNVDIIFLSSTNLNDYGSILYF